jgi:hypothetical protein
MRTATSRGSVPCELGSVKEIGRDSQHPEQNQIQGNDIVEDLWCQQDGQPGNQSQDRLYDYAAMSVHRSHHIAGLLQECAPGR